MCRFLMVQSKEKVESQKFLHLFANMCETSVSPYGGKQKDGWGVAWLDEYGAWKELKSLNPMWEDKEKFFLIPKTTTLVAHTRRAPDSYGIGLVAYNEPYIANDYCFVFNGRVNGVSLKKPVPGDVGAQKIWSLLQKKLREQSPSQALLGFKTFLEKNSREIIALNIGLASKDSLTALCKYNGDKNYFALRTKTGKINIICSGNLRGLKFLQMENNQIVVFDEVKNL